MDILKRESNKCIKILILVFISTLLSYTIPSNVVFAKSKIDVIVDKQMLQKGEIVEMTVNVKNTEIKAGTLQIYFDTTKLEYVKEAENSNFIENRIIYTWVDDNLSKTDIAKTEKFKFKSIGDGTTNIIVTGSFYDKNGEAVYLEDGAEQVIIGQQSNTITIDKDKIESGGTVNKSNTNLKVLRLDKEGISPEFQKEITEYYFIADDMINSLQVTAIPENEKSQVTVTGNVNLKQGLNTIKIQVESEDKTKKREYKIYVTKTKNKELANANLENLAIKEGMLYPAFDANITKYGIEVANDTNNLTILAVPERIKAKAMITGGKNLKVGNNTVVVKVIAEDGITIKKYVITAHRRNEEEEINAKQEQENQTEQLSSILENEDGQDKENNEQNKKNINEKNINYFVTGMIMLAIIFIIGLMVYIYWRRKNVNKK